jgi:predicted PurR-regulated permease PerM
MATRLPAAEDYEPPASRQDRCARRWQSELAYPGALQAWAQRTDATALLGWAQSLGQFMARHASIIAFTILLLFFLYREGHSLAKGFRRLLCHSIGERADGYIDLATRAVRASVNSMLVVALFDGFTPPSHMQLPVSRTQD